MARVGYCRHNIKWPGWCVHCEEAKLRHAETLLQHVDVNSLKPKFLQLLRDDPDFAREIKQILESTI